VVGGVSRGIRWFNESYWGIGGMVGWRSRGRNDVTLMSKQSSDVTRVGFDLEGG